MMPPGATWRAGVGLAVLLLAVLWASAPARAQVILGVFGSSTAGTCPTPGEPSCCGICDDSTLWCWPREPSDDKLPPGYCPLACMCCDDGTVGSRLPNTGFSACCETTSYTLQPCASPAAGTIAQLCGCPLSAPMCTSTGCEPAAPQCAGRPTTATAAALATGAADSSNLVMMAAAGGDTNPPACNVTGLTPRTCVPPDNCVMLECIPDSKRLHGGCGYLPHPDALNYSSMAIADLVFPPSASQRTFPCLHVVFVLGPGSTYSITLVCRHSSSRGAVLVTALELMLQEVCNSRAATGSGKRLYWQATGLDSDTPQRQWSTSSMLRLAGNTASMELAGAAAAVQAALLSQPDRSAQSFDAAYWAKFRDASSYSSNLTDTSNTTGPNATTAGEVAGEAGAGRRRLLQQCLAPPAFSRDVIDQGVCDQLNQQCPRGAKFAKVCVPITKVWSVAKWVVKKQVLPPVVKGVLLVCDKGMKLYTFSCLNKKSPADCAALDSDVNFVCDQKQCNCGYYNTYTPCYSICVLHRCSCPASLCPLPVIPPVA